MTDKLKPNLLINKSKQDEVENQNKYNWLEKLKPCSKNAIIKDIIFNTLNTSNISKYEETDKNKKGIKILGNYIFETHFV